MTAPDTPATPGVPTFDSALRGYDRAQVDEWTTAATGEIAKLRADLTESRRRLRLATDHAEATERELRDARATPTTAAPPAEEGFGFRAEKLLRLAEQEATDMRSNASREASALLEKARNDAEQHRHQVEQDLIARESVTEQHAARRAAELQDREQQIADQLVTAREQADQLHAAATRTAERLREESEAAAAQTRVRAEQQARRQRDQAEQEVARLTGVQDGVRAELARLADALAGELARPSQSIPAQRADDGPRHGTGAQGGTGPGGVGSATATGPKDGAPGAGEEGADPRSTAAARRDAAAPVKDQRARAADERVADDRNASVAVPQVDVGPPGGPAWAGGVKFGTTTDYRNVPLGRRRCRSARPGSRP